MCFQQVAEAGSNMLIVAGASRMLARTTLVRLGVEKSAALLDRVGTAGASLYRRRMKARIASVIRPCTPSAGRGGGADGRV